MDYLSPTYSFDYESENIQEILKEFESDELTAKEKAAQTIAEIQKEEASKVASARQNAQTEKEKIAADVAAAKERAAQEIAKIQKEIVKKSWEAGVNFFDTAEVYGAGQAEKMFGEIFKTLDADRKDLVITTKLFWGNNKTIN